jgi:S-adenosylmethionine/arginine decarboxylase-like enzyme
MDDYGKELILDIHNCDVSKFNRKDIEDYLIELCGDVIDMEREDLHWWDYEDDLNGYKEAPSHLKGTSCAQFILTSTIIIHSLDDLKKIFINIFSCKDFDTEMAAGFTEKYFGGKVETYEVITRQ